MSPALPVTGIGSVPHGDVADAVAFVAATCPEIPYWPQRPLRGFMEGMIGQTLGVAAKDVRLRSDGRAAVTSSAFDQRAPSPAPIPTGLASLLRSMARDPWPHVEAVKGQVTGPVTLGWCLVREETPLTQEPGGLELAERIVSARIDEQLDALHESGRPLLLFLDEPCLPLALEAAGERAEILEPLRRCLRRIEARGAVSGLHCCDRPPLAAIAELAPGILSVDALSGIEGFCSDPAAPALLRSNIRLALGLGPTRPEDLDVTADALCRRVHDAAGSRLSRLLEGALITPACGVAGLDEAQAQRSFRIAREVARQLGDR